MTMVTMRLMTGVATKCTATAASNFRSFLLRISVGKSPYILFGTRGLFGYAVEKIMYIRTMWYIALVDILKWLQELAMR